MRGAKLVLQRAETYLLVSGSIRDMMLALLHVVPLGATCISHLPALLAKVLYVLGTRPSSKLSRRWYARSRAVVKARG